MSTPQVTQEQAIAVAGKSLAAGLREIHEAALAGGPSGHGGSVTHGGPAADGPDIPAGQSFRETQPVTASGE